MWQLYDCSNTFHHFYQLKKVPYTLKITSEVGVGSVKVNNLKIDDKAYTSSNYENASSKVEMDIDVGTGSVEIVTE